MTNEDTDIKNTLLEIQKGNRTILRRISDVLDKEHHGCGTECHAAVDQAEIRTFNERVSVLEENDRKQREELDAMKQEFEEFEKLLKPLKSFSKEDTDPSHSDTTERMNVPKSDFTTNITTERNAGSGVLDEECVQRPVSPKSVDETAVCETGKANNARPEKEEITPDAPDKDKTREADQSREAIDGAAIPLSTAQTSVVCEDAKQRRVAARKVTTPNFTKKNANKHETREHKKPAVKHDSKRTYVTVDKWWEICKQEEKAGEKTEVKYLDGVHTILCVDISESMEDCWPQVQTFVHDYLDGLEKLITDENFNEENVALVTFGHETKALVRSTKELAKIRTAFDSITLGGPTPLFAGILMAVCAAQSNGMKCFVKGAEIPKRIVLISDGDYTEAELVTGPDTVPSRSKLDETMAHLVSIIEDFPGSGKELICVPVGNANMVLHNQLKDIACGKKITYREGSKLARRYYLTTKAPVGLGGIIGADGGVQLGLPGLGLPGMEEIPEMSGLNDMLKMRLAQLQPMAGANSTDSSDTTGLSSEDQEHIQEIVADHKRFTLEAMMGRIPNRYEDSDNANLPKVGSRMRRGPDWKWNNQDDGGPGTVIGHSGDQVWVDWDLNRQPNVYRYGSSGQYDVLIVDEPRQIGSKEDMQVGCSVLPGAGWPYDNRRVKHHEIGVVIRHVGHQRVQVKWENGYRGDYSYNPNGRSELKLHPRSIRYDSTNPDPTRATKQNKNKNAVLM